MLVVWKFKNVWILKRVKNFMQNYERIQINDFMWYKRIIIWLSFGFTSELLSVVIIVIIPLFCIFIFIDPIPLIVIRTFTRFSKLPLPLAWEQFCWFIPSFSFLSCVRIFFTYFLQSLIANSMCGEHGNISIF